MKNELTELKLTLKELEKEILKKLEAIKTRVLTKSSGNLHQDLQILALANDELDDVLLNWDFSSIGTIPEAPSFEDFED